MSRRNIIEVNERRPDWLTIDEKLDLKYKLAKLWRENGAMLSYGATIQALIPEYNDNARPQDGWTEWAVGGDFLIEVLLVVRDEIADEKRELQELTEPNEAGQQFCKSCGSMREQVSIRPS